MRLFSSLLLGLVALSAPLTSHALSAQSTLARLSQRLAAAETALAQLTSQTHEHEHTQAYDQSLMEYTPAAHYTWDNGQYTELGGGGPAVKVPSWFSNIAIISNTARGATVLSRSASSSQATSKVSLPFSLQANSAFTIAAWINWGGASQPNKAEAVAVSTAGDALKLAVSSAGEVTGTVAGAAIAAGPITAGIWTHFALAYDGAHFTLFRNGQPVSAPVVTPAAFPASPNVNLLNNDDTTLGWVGLLDNVHIFTSRLDDQEIQFVYDDTRIGATGQSQIIVDGPDRWWGHTATSTVKFQNTVTSQPTGDITLSGSFIDAEFRAVNQLWFIMYGVTGTTNTAGVAIDYQGTKGFVTWDVATGILVFQPAASMATVPLGAQWSFTIPGSALNLVNPNTNKLTSPNDPRWMISIFRLELNQTPGRTRRQSLRWQGIENTPITQNPNA